MELASHGIEVHLYDKNERCLTQASAQNEGKIHLGYVYANDPSLRTARTMIEGALSFAPLMRGWIGDVVDSVPVSTPFYYAVHRASLLSVDEVESHLISCHAIAREQSRDLKPDYFGFDPHARPIRLSNQECHSIFDQQSVSGAFRTPEISVDPEALAAAVRARLATNSRIQCRLRTIVHGAEPMADGVWIEWANAKERAKDKYDHAVNCLWEGRLAVDQSAGVKPDRPWLYRLKYYVRLETPDASKIIPSVTTVLGPFGDIAVFGDKYVYLSWYPAGMRATSSEISPPAWPPAQDEAVEMEIRRGIVDGLTTIVPSLTQIPSAHVEGCELKAGIIFAWGESDIDDSVSRLHKRDEIGPQSHGRYHSINTGKLTTAPLFAKQVADQISQLG
jgi:hypothetical protein